MMTLTHSASAVRPRSAGGYQLRNLVHGTWASARTWSQRRRQKIALDRLDNRLRKDIGLPPRPVDPIVSGFAGLF